MLHRFWQDWSSCLSSHMFFLEPCPDVTKRLHQKHTIKYHGKKSTRPVPTPVRFTDGMPNQNSITSIMNVSCPNNSPAWWMRLSEPQAFIDLQSLLSLKVWRGNLDRGLAGNWAEEQSRLDGMDFALVLLVGSMLSRSGHHFDWGDETFVRNLKWQNVWSLYQ